MGRRLHVGHRGARRSWPRIVRDLRSGFRIAREAGLRSKGTRWPFRRSVLETLFSNPRAARTTFSMAALYLHLGPFARLMDSRLAGIIRSLD